MYLKRCSVVKNANSGTHNWHARPGIGGGGGGGSGGGSVGVVANLHCIVLSWYITCVRHCFCVWCRFQFFCVSCKMSIGFVYHADFYHTKFLFRVHWGVSWLMGRNEIGGWGITIDIHLKRTGVKNWSVFSWQMMAQITMVTIYSIVFDISRWQYTTINNISTIKNYTMIYDTSFRATTALNYLFNKAHFGQSWTWYPLVI